VSPCQIQSKSLKPRPRYGDFSIFKDGGRHHLGFLNFENLTDGKGQGVELRHSAKFCRNWSNCGRHMAIFRFCKMAAAAILDCQNLKLLTVERLQRAELRHRAKFGREQSNRGRVMAFFGFARWRPPPSWIFKILNF